jgi:hypothetical protein
MTTMQYFEVRKKISIAEIRIYALQAEQSLYETAALNVSNMAVNIA